MAELDPNIPLNFLSGAYTKNYWKDQPLSTMMDTYLTARKNQQAYDEIERKKQAYANVAKARQGISDQYAGEYNKTLNSELNDINEAIAIIDAKINNMRSMEGYKSNPEVTMEGYKPLDETVYNRNAINASMQPDINMLGYVPSQSPSAEQLMSGYRPQARGI